MRVIFNTTFFTCDILKLIAIELAAILGLVLTIGITEISYNSYIFIENKDIRVFSHLVGFSPILFFYILLRMIFRVPFGLFGILFLYFLLIEINLTKQALTINPLSWTDISSSESVSIFWRYAELWHLLFFALLIGVVSLAIKFKQVYLQKRNISLVSAAILMLLIPFAFHPYVGKVNETLGHKLEEKLTDLGVRYYSWDWSHNLKSSGLILHLIQTSRREMPDIASNIEVNFFETLHDSSQKIMMRPKNIIIILCEACWLNDRLFKSAFAPLQSLKFKQVRAISPVYGGGEL